MRLFVQNMVIEASIDPCLESPVLVLAYECCPIEPAFAHLHRFEIVEAPAGERDAMNKSGYHLPDHNDEYKAA